MDFLTEELQTLDVEEVVVEVEEIRITAVAGEDAVVEVEAVSLRGPHTRTRTQTRRMDTRNNRRS